MSILNPHDENLSPPEDEPRYCRDCRRTLEPGEDPLCENCEDDRIRDEEMELFDENEY